MTYFSYIRTSRCHLYIKYSLTGLKGRLVANLLLSPNSAIVPSIGFNRMDNLKKCVLCIANFFSINHADIRCKRRLP